MTLDEKLTKGMKRVVGLHSLLDGYEHADYDGKAAVLSRFPDRAALSRDGISEIDAELHGYGNDVDKYKLMQGILGSGQERIRPDYEANLDEILAGVTEKLNKDLEGAENPLDAVSRIAYAFSPLVGRKNPTQEEANSLLREELSEEYGVTFRNVKADNPLNYKGRLLSIGARSLVLNYLKEEKDKDDKVSYTVDADKLKKDIKENPIMGSILYLVEKPKKESEEGK